MHSFRQFSQFVNCYLSILVLKRTLGLQSMGLRLYSCRIGMTPSSTIICEDSNPSDISDQEQYIIYYNKRCNIKATKNHISPCKVALIIISIRQYCSILFYCFIMFLPNQQMQLGAVSLPHSFVARMESQYTEINENINKLIDDLGVKMKKELVDMQERNLVKYKDHLLELHQDYRTLRERRNEDVIKENIMSMKSTQEKLYQQFSEKSLEISKMYDRLKVEFKRVTEHSHQLELELVFLQKQIKNAKTKSDSINQQLQQHEDRKHKQTARQLQKSQSLRVFQKHNDRYQSNSSQMQKDSLFQKRLRDKTDNLKDFLAYMSQQQTLIQSIFSKYEWEQARTQKQRHHIFEKVFQDKAFKNLVYHSLIPPKQNSSKFIK